MQVMWWMPVIPVIWHSAGGSSIAT